MKIGFYLFSNVHNKPDTASSRIRGRWLIKYWEGAEELHYGRKYDAIYYQKVYEPEHARLFDGVKILDVCDPDYLDEKLPFMEMVEAVDVVTVSTNKLKDVIQGWTSKPVIMIPDRHDLEYFKCKKIHKGRASEVCWFGYAHNSKALNSIREYLYRNNIGINIIADDPVYISDESKDIIIKERFTKWNIETVNKEIVKSDFVVFPGSRDPNSRFKSNNKTIHSYLLGMPVATSVEQFERFIDPIERQKEADKNYEMAVRDYDVRISVQEYKNIIERIQNEQMA